MNSSNWNMVARMLALGTMVLVLGASSASAQKSTQKKPVAVRSMNTEGTVLTRYTLVYKNIGPDGFYRSEMTSDDDATPMETLVIATDPGHDKIDFVEVPAVKKDPPRLIDYAKEKIAGGTLKGEHNFTEKGIRYEVTWHAADSYNLTIEEIHRVAE